MKNLKARDVTEQKGPTIAEGLADLAQLFLNRSVPVATVSLTRNKATYEHVVQSAQQEDIACKIVARVGKVTIAVSCLSQMSPDVNADLGSLTTWAAIAAAEWTNPPLVLLIENEKTCAPMIGASRQMRDLCAEINRAARTNHTVLLLGESGTGKTTAAAMIHQRSPRANNPFVDFNCAAIPDTLLESELFGYEKGAFTGAVSTKAGLFETAANGTLFLDEIGELKFELQAKLLTAIEQQRTRRLGSTNYAKHDVRIIAASSRNLLRMMNEGTFRKDLYYRLSVLEIALPPLRQRRDDIPLLVADKLKHEEQRSGGPVRFAMQNSAITELNNYDWPGNIRQLQNVISRLCARFEGQCITRDSVRKELIRFDQERYDGESRTTDGSVLLPANCRKLLPGESIQQFTARVKRALIETVRAQTGSMKKTSARLAMERTALTKLRARLKEASLVSHDLSNTQIQQPP
ncbi:MAG TPA: sigma-54 dependent transcriptional regulator [Pyrinomonadaceae bacterium]|nr:sigma-54 dependent transcriptional regulator [Pyrinomonadaceae bacterium]